MLCNTLGIVIFIMVFTVLTTGNAVTHTAFPMEKTDTGLKDFTVICKGNRICPSEPAFYDLERVAKARDNDNIMHWTYEDGNCKAHWVSGSFSVSIEAKADGGDTPGDVGAAGSTLLSLLAHESPNTKFVNFLVYPDSLGAFSAARTAARNAGFQTGWSAVPPGDAVQFRFGGGVGPRPQ
jgi:hypothetical protein